MKSSNKHCRGSEYGNYNTTEEARQACTADSSCQSVYDVGCNDGDEENHLCPIGTDYKWSSSSCIYEKGRKYVHVNEVANTGFHTGNITMYSTVIEFYINILYYYL